MSENKKKREVSNKTFALFLGIGLVLLNIILIINVGYVARVFNFVPLYLFGMMSWTLFIYMLVDGVFLIVKREHLHFQNKVRVVGLVIGFVALSVLVSLMASNNLGKILFINTNEEKNHLAFFGGYNNTVWKNIFSISDGGYFHLAYLNLFSYSVGGGLFGYTLAGLLNTLFSGSQAASYIIASVTLFLAIALFFLPNLMDVIANRKEAPKKERKSDKPRKSVRSNESDIIREASYIEAKPVEEVRPQQQSQFISNPGYYQAQNMDAFSIARFHPSFDANEQQVNPETGKTVSNNQPQQETTTQKVEQAPVREEKVEQMDIFETSKPVYDEQVVTAQPIFEQEQIE